MQTQAKPKPYTPAEYLSLEEVAEERSEYRNGEVVSMAGGTANHNRIAGEFYKQCPTAIGDQVYESFIGDVRLWIPRFSLYAYPDIMIIQGAPIYHQDRTDTVETPPPDYGSLIEIDSAV
ncbi:MAG: Uma2 family endonuclease [Cyanobacteria bacterium J06626_14]